MFVPALYEARLIAQVCTLMTRHPIAVLTTNGEPAPWATHVPIVRPPDAVEHKGDDLGQMVGDVYWGHLNAANPHADSLRDGQHAKLIFSGPDGYVSPALYGTPTPAAPTWDFAVVHVEGVLKLVDGEDEKLRIVGRTAAEFEREFGMRWGVDGSHDYFRSIVHGVLGFTLSVTKVEAMLKLSQERSAVERDRIAARMERCGAGVELGGLIRTCDRNGGHGLD
jgi:transcriptional regulator